MPAKSKAQQKAAGAELSAKRGDTKPSELKGASRQMYDSMSEKQLDDFEKRELLAVIENYRLNLVPLIVPLTLLKHYIDKFQQAYLKDQYYLDPHPLELKLRNHA